MTYKNAFTKGFGLDFINIQAIKWEKIDRGRFFLRKIKASFTFFPGSQSSVLRDFAMFEPILDPSNKRLSSNGVDFRGFW